MTWFRVDDGFPEHPKLEELEHEPRLYMAAITVWTIMGADCARRLTDGVVSHARLTKVLGRLGKSARNGAEALVKCGLWVEVEGGWKYHDWGDYQPTKIDVNAIRKSKTERQRRWRRNSAEARVDALVDASTDAAPSASTNASVDAPVDAAPVRASPVPAQPVPARPSPAQISDPEFARGSAAVPLAAPGSDSAPSEPEPPDPDADPPQRSETWDAAPADDLPATTVATSEPTVLTVPSWAGNQHSAKPQRKQSVAKTKQESQPSKSAGAWAAYTAAYQARYTTPPVRNARVNAQMAQFCSRVAADEAPAIAEHYLRSQNSRYLASGHSVGCLLQDAEKLRTEWVTGRHSTAHAARTADRTTGRGEAYREMMDRLRLEDEADARRMSNGH